MQWKSSFSSLGMVMLAIFLANFPLSQLSLALPDGQDSKLISLKFPPTGKNRGAPKTTAGGGTRSDSVSCLVNEEGEMPLVALMPNRENTSKTSASTPTIYWYLPETTATKGEFVLTDENDEEAYYATFDLPDKPGIIKLTIPEKVTLEPGKIYDWSMMVICDSRYRNRDKYVTGKLEYVALPADIDKQISSASPLEKAEIYAQSSIWLETLDIVAEARTNNPSGWQELLQSVGLEGLTDKAFVSCCTASE